MTKSRTRARRLLGGIAATATLAGTALSFGAVNAPTSASAVTVPGGGVTVSQAWKKSLTYGKSVWLGSAGVGDLDGKGPSVIVGDRAGKIFAFHSADGTGVSGWPYTADARIMSTPSVSGTGTGARVYVGVGSSDAPAKGGYLKLSNTGHGMWYRKVTLLPGNRGGNRGVMSSLAIGPIQGSADVVGGSMGQLQLAMDTGTGKTLQGFPWLQADTNFSTPALADLDGKGKNYIIEGGDSTAGRAGLDTYTNGGHIRIMRPTANYGRPYMNSGLLCQFNTNQVVQSSPAVGRFLDGGHTLGIVAGTGAFYQGASDTNMIYAINTKCQQAWHRKLDGGSIPSPAIADVDGLAVTSPDVVTISGAGTLYVLSGTSGAVRWSIPLGGGASGSVTTFKSPTGNFQYILAPTGNGVWLINGLTHAKIKITSLHSGSAATVTADRNGKIGITALGFDGHGTGIIEHYTVDGAYSVRTVQTPGSWPMFHHDPQLTGLTRSAAAIY